MELIYAERISSYNKGGTQETRFSNMKSCVKLLGKAALFIVVLGYTFTANASEIKRTEHSMTGIKLTAMKLDIPPKANPYDYSIMDIAYGGGKFVAVSMNGVISYSSNGVNWTAIPSGEEDGTTSTFSGSNVRGVMYGGDKFLAWGGQGKLAYSTNGENWISIPKLESIFGGSGIFRIAYGGGKFVAVGHEKVAHSSDGVNWTPILQGNEIYAMRGLSGNRGIVYGAGKFIAVGYFGEISYSADGENWISVNEKKARVPITVDSLKDIIHADGKFVAVGNGRIAHSIDGMSWVSVKTDFSVSGIAYGDGKFVVAGTSKVAFSTDAENWISVPRAAIDKIRKESGVSADFTRIAYGGDKFVAVGYSGVMAYTADDENWIIDTSYFNRSADNNDDKFVVVEDDDGKNLTAHPINSSFGANRINDIAHGNGIFVAVGVGGKIGYSTDGEKWIPIAPGNVDNTTGAFAQHDINSIVYGGGRFVAVGDGGKMAHSTNGVNWVAIPGGGATGVFGADILSDINGIAYGNGRFVAVGFCKIAYSNNGIDWIAVQGGTSHGSTSYIKDIIHGVAYGNGVFVAVGYFNGIAYSTNGENWIPIAKDFVRNTFYKSILSVAFGGGKFVAVGDGGRMAYSTDGASWTAIPPGVARGTSTFDTTDIYSVAYCDNKFIAVGEYGKMAYSADGVNWIAMPQGGANNSIGIFGRTGIRGVASGGGKVVAVGDGGKMAHSADGVKWTIIPPGGVIRSGVNWTVLSNKTFGLVSISNSATISGIAFGDGKFVAGIRLGGEMLYSSDAINWKAIPEGAENNTTTTFEGMIPSGKQFYASPYGVGFADKLIHVGINGIAYGGGKFVAVGDYGRMAYSTNGVNWIAIPPGIFNKISGTFGKKTSITGVAHGGDKFIAWAENGALAYSTNGVNWVGNGKASQFGMDSIKGIAHGDGKFVAVGENGKMAYSINGVKWTALPANVVDKGGIFGVPSGYFADINGIAYGNGKFIAVGQRNKMAYSTDGVKWIAMPTNSKDDDRLDDRTDIVAIAYGDGKFVVARKNGYLLYSTNGLDWVGVLSGDVNGDKIYGNITSLAHGDGKFVAAGDTFLAFSPGIW